VPAIFIRGNFIEAESVQLLLWTRLLPYLDSDLSQIRFTGLRIGRLREFPPGSGKVLFPATDKTLIPVDVVPFPFTLVGIPLGHVNP